jgi:hypothetical protein
MAAQNPERDIAVLEAQAALHAAQIALLAEQNGTAFLAAQTALVAAQNGPALLAEQNRARELDKKNVRYNNLRSFL